MKVPGDFFLHQPTLKLRLTRPAGKLQPMHNLRGLSEQNVITVI
jgi:hypothetical protein